MTEEVVKRKHEKVLKPKPEQEVFISVGPNLEDYGITPEDRKRVSLVDLEFYSTKEPLVRRGLNLKSRSIMNATISAISKDEDAERMANNVLQLPNFKEFLVEAIKHAFGYGDGYLENIWEDTVDDAGVKRKEIAGFAITDPKTIEPKWDEHGYIIKYLQKIPKQGKIQEFPPEKFSHFLFDRVADNVTGLGLVEPLVSTIHTIMVARKATGDLLFRHGIPFIHLIKTGATPKDIPKLKKVAQRISNSTSFASSEKYKFDFHGITGKGMDFSPQLDFLFDTLAGGLGIAKPILLQAGEQVNRATLEALALTNRDEYQMYRQKVGLIIEEQIFRPLMEANNKATIPEVIWEVMTPESDEIVIKNNSEFIKMMGEAVKNDFLSQDEAKEQVRDKLNIEQAEDKGGEEKEDRKEGD